MMAYLTHMAVRLVELHRVLTPTGSIYLHCDPTASHYLKLIMDYHRGAVRRQEAQGSPHGARLQDGGPRRARRPNRVRSVTMPKLSATAAPIVLPLIVTFIMSNIIAGLSTVMALGLSPGWLMAWLKAWMSSWAIAFPVLTVVLPMARRIVGRIVEAPQT
jgi:hypothetical protein